LNSQLRTLLANNADKHSELLELIKQFRDDEVHHHDIGKISKAYSFNLLSSLNDVLS
jgi:ubiquinone biosynthesis monooxygenase Coq7